MVYGIKKGAWRRVPLNAPEPVRPPVPERAAGQSDEAFAASVKMAEDLWAAARAPAEELRAVKVVVRNRGRTKALEIQVKAREMEAAGDGHGAAEHIVRETVVGLEPYVVVDPDRPENSVDLKPGVDVERLVDELDGQHLLEVVALAGLSGQQPSPSQTSF